MAEYDSPRPTSQPVGSTDLAAAKDNLITLDQMVNAESGTELTNRKGAKLTPLIDIIDGANSQIAAALASAGSQIVGDFADAVKVEITEANQVYTSKSVVDSEDAIWRTNQTLPYTPTGSDPSNSGDAEFGKWVLTAQGELKSAAITVGCKYTEIIYSTDITTTLGDVRYIYNSQTQVAYVLPNGIGSGEVIVSVVDDTLTTNANSYKMYEAVIKALPNFDSFKALTNITEGAQVEISGVAGVIINSGIATTEVPGYIVPLDSDNTTYWKRAGWSGSAIEMSAMEGGHTEDNFSLAITYLESLIAGTVAKTLLTISESLYLTKEHIIDPTKVSLLGTGSANLIFDDSTLNFATRYPNGVALNIYSSRAFSNNIVYSQTASSFMTNLRMTTLGAAKTLGALKLSADNEVMSLNSMYNVRFSGFGTGFTNGDNGWGWSFFHCGWNSCALVASITNSANTFERFDFHGCIAQNGNGGFVINNPDGCVYWYGGSFDFCAPEWVLTNGHAEVHGTHVEVTGRGDPYVTISSGNDSFKQFGGLFALRDTNLRTVELFDQYLEMQAHLEGVTFESDGTSLDTMTVASKRVTGSGNKPAATTARIFRCEGYNLAGVDYQSFITESIGNFSTTKNTDSIVLTGTAGGGGKAFNLLLPVPDAKLRYSFEFDFVSTATGTIFQTKRFTTLVGVDPTNKYNQTAISGGTADSIAAGGSGTIDMDKSFAAPSVNNNHIWLNLNNANLGENETLTISNIKLYYY